MIRNIEPFIGPRPFNRNKSDQKRFFGRDYDTDEIVTLISSHKLSLIYGQTGAGKTSIFNAQIIPSLEQDGYEVLPVVRVGSSMISPFDPTEITNTYIFNSLQSLKSDLNPNIFKNKSLLKFLKEYFPINKDHNNRVKQQILIYDQLEEIFNIYPRNWKEQQQDFFNQIANALDDIYVLRIVLIIREDYLAPLDPFRNVLPQYLRAHYRLERLRSDSALLAIKGPLANVPKDLIKDYKGDIDQDINIIVHDLMKIQIEYQPGKTMQIEGEFIEPIQLQVVAKRWFEKITNVHNNNFKPNLMYVSDVDNALEEFYEDAINEVVKKGKIKERFIRKWCEDNLITQGGTRSIVYEGASTTAGLKNDLVKVLESKYLIKENLRAGARWCELTHDRLIKPIRSSNQKWRNEQQKRKKAKIIKVSLTSAIVSLIFIVINFYINS